MQAFNYVVFIPDAQQIKFGRTRNIKRRVAEHRRAACRAGFYDIRWSAMPALPGVVRLTELNLRQAMFHCVIPGHLEWVAGDKDIYREVIVATRRIQKQVNALLEGAQHARA